MQTAPRPEHEHVVPVAAHLALAARDVAGGELEFRDLRQRGGQEAALQHRGGGPLDLGGASLHGQGDPVGHQLEESRVVGGERARGEGADVQNAEHGAADEQRHPSRDRMPFSRRSGLSTFVWSTCSRITGRFSAAMRPAKPLPRGIRTPWRTSSSMPRAAVATRYRPDGFSSRTAAVSTASSSRTLIEEFVEQLVDVELCQPGVGHRLQAPEPVAEFIHEWGFST